MQCALLQELHLTRAGTSRAPPAGAAKRWADKTMTTSNTAIGLLSVLLALFAQPIPASLAGGTDPNEFDLFKHYTQVSSVDLVVLKGWTRYDHVGGIINEPTLVVGHAKCEIGSVAQDFDHWTHSDFRRLFKDYDPKRQYEDCFCSPKYAIAIIFYVQSPGTFNERLEKKKVALALFDESHDSVLVSDTKRGVRSFRFSEGHTEYSRVPKLISRVLASAGIQYEFMKR